MQKATLFVITYSVISFVVIAHHVSYLLSYLGTIRSFMGRPVVLIQPKRSI